MKHDLAWIAAEGITLLLTLCTIAMTLAALLNVLEISSIFSAWFESSYVPALLALVLFGLRFLSKSVAVHFLYDDNDVAPLSDRKPVQNPNSIKAG